MFLCAIYLFAPRTSHAQTEDHLPPPPGYASFVPDVPDDVHEDTSVDTHWFTLRLGAAPILDYSWFTQDQPNVEQVGVEEDEFDVRSARVQLRGSLFNDADYPWRYLVSFEYRGLDTDPNNNWSFTDWAVTAPVGALGELTAGKVKESFVYEMIGDAANLPHLERLLSPFFTSRNIGLRLNKTVFEERMTLSAGVFNDWWAKDLAYDESGWDVTARLTGLASWSDSGRRFLHLGTAWRYVGADDGLLRYRGRPESNVTDYFVDTTLDVDTGGFPASHANHWGAELLWNEGPVSFLAEYAAAFVSSIEAEDPVFDGYYLTGSWVLTGEHRSYDRKVGYARRVLPEGFWGAVELIGRYGIVDLNDKGIEGGRMEKWFTAVNWWATRRWRFSVGFGESTLDRFGLVGETSQVLTRVQWIY
jgi:phosphate-selective porin OprO/OprP